MISRTIYYYVLIRVYTGYSDRNDVFSIIQIRGVGTRRRRIIPIQYKTMIKAVKLLHFHIYR